MYGPADDPVDEKQVFSWEKTFFSQKIHRVASPGPTKPLSPPGHGEAPPWTRQTFLLFIEFNILFYSHSFERIIVDLTLEVDKALVWRYGHYFFVRRMVEIHERLMNFSHFWWISRPFDHDLVKRLQKNSDRLRLFIQELPTSIWRDFVLWNDVNQKNPHGEESSKSCCSSEEADYHHG